VHSKKVRILNENLYLQRMKTQIINRFVLLLIILPTLLWSCEREDDDNFYQNAPTMAAELRLNSDTLWLGENTVTLNTYVYRDFMPIAEENGSPLISVCILADINNLPFLEPVVMLKQFVIYDDLVWSSEFEQITETTPFAYNGVSRGGPKWGPDISVDVVCEFSYQGALYRIIARDQVVHRTS